MTSSCNHEHVSVSTIVNDQVINGCYLKKETTTECIYLKAFQVESDSISFSVTYETNHDIRHENLHGHMIKIPLERPHPVLGLEHNIPEQFLVSQETCLNHVMIVLSEMYLPPATQERLVSYISTESLNFSSRHRGEGGGGGGFRIEVNVKVHVDHWVRIECCNKDKDTSCEVQARQLKTKLAATDCPICLTELSSGLSRLELHCSHVFHTECVMNWLMMRNPSCPICRANVVGKTVSVY
ncbi:hypothetical protein EUTSA_v10015640mg [Eutrema salsugineum]|uniref:RING-type domain-containing protein n=1 Tax=Eutrema salsugineum TaxID=72664 RepID=V4LGT5_EUTSA|nr:uncharacterized protein LOC18016540 [Eutrema salsugineum]ESQ42954.1 hypothetical protein EUTSA_v10015640mg [Eutrema salsugineum]